MAGGAQDASEDAITGINVTPLVDITLVLLIIFMVTAKLIVSSGVPLDLPKASAQSATEVQTIFSVILTSDNRTLVDTKEIRGDDAIAPLARDAKEKNAELRAVIKADSAVPHGRVIHVLDLLKQAGVSKIAFGVSTSPASSTSGIPAAPARSN